MAMTSEVAVTRRRSDTETGADGSIHTFTRVRLFVVVGAALAALLIAGTFYTYAHVNSASQQSAKIEQRIGVETNSIVGSDASVSTYGLDPARTVDW